MSKIKNLIKKLCPNGVEYIRINDCCNFQNGFAFKSNLFKDSGDILLRITNIDGKEINLSDVKYIDKNDYNVNLDNYIVNDDEIVIAMSGATTGKIGINKTHEILYLNQRVGKITPNTSKLNNHFLYHILLSKTSYFYQLAGGGAQPNLSTDAIKSTLIPLPPLEVQEEIVRILDKFGELEAELDAELEARKSQYEFWCGKLLDNDYETEALDSLCIKTNNINWKNDFETYKYIDLSSVNRDNNTIEETIDIDSTNAPSRARQIVKCNDILFGTTRPMLKRITIVSKEYDNQICSTGYCVLRPDQNKILPEWMYFNLQTEKFYKYVESFQQGASYPSISDSAVKNYEISIPPLEEQKRIVKILDKFDKLVNDITVGLPAEIELRKQQYEYYRNKLLSFEEYVNE